MSKVILRLVCVLLTVTGGMGDCVTDGTTLLQVFLVNRHGDRTPLSTAIPLSTNIKAVEAITSMYGYGQLTNAGIRNAYNYGRFIRDRYSSLISPQYNSSEIYIRSTDSTRAKMTVLAAMAAVYPPYPGSWSEEINWVPVPYTTVPAKYDFNLATLNCPTYMAAALDLKLSNNSRMDQYSDVFNILSTISDDDMLNYPVKAAFLYHDVYKSQESLGVPLGPVANAVLPRLREAAGEAAHIMFANENSKTMNAGVLLNEFFTYASNIIAGEDTPRVRVYSGHDSNVLSILAASRITPRLGVVKYSAAFGLELRRVEETGQHVVLPIYLPAPGEDLLYLHIDGCDSGSPLCDLQKFKDLVSKNLLDEYTWRKKCGFTEDLVIDDSIIN